MYTRSSVLQHRPVWCGVRQRFPGQQVASQAAREVQVRAYTPTTEYDYDLFTIGGGSGGVRASRISSGFGAKVACAELPFAYVSGEKAGGLGGTCVLRGCVPKKLFMYCGEYAEFMKDAQGFGWEVSPGKLDWAKFMSKKRAELERLNSVYGKILGGADVETMEIRGVPYLMYGRSFENRLCMTSQGRATIKDAHTVEINGKEITSKYICVAVGGTPSVLDIPGKEHCITSDHILELDEVPKRLAIIGAGYIGVEFGGIFKNLGSDVEFFLRRDKVLNGFDEEVRSVIMEEYTKNGIKMNTGCSPKSIKKLEDGSFELTYSSPDGEATSTFDQILMATGRGPNTTNLGLEKAGVEVDKKGFIKVDEYSKTSVDSIYAVGDITDRMALTPVALMEGMAMAKTLFNDEPTKPDHRFIPTAVFSNPQIGTIGYPEEDAVEKYGDVDVYASSFRPMRNTISGNEGRGTMKIVVDANTDKVVGIHIVGPESGEIMQGFGVAVKMGATKKDLDSCVGIHPSAAEELVTMRSVSRQYRNKKLVE